MYKRVEQEFLKAGQIVPINNLPWNANIVNSHTLYKIEMNDDRSLKMNGRIARRGIAVNLKDEMKIMVQHVHQLYFVYFNQSQL